LIVDTLGRQTGAPPATDRRPFAAALPVNAATAVVDFGREGRIEAHVVAGMVLVWNPENVKPSPETKVHVTARDAKGAVVYEGELPLV